MSDAIASLAAENRFPLFVIAAGNDGIDASYSGYNQAKLDYPNQVIVVGGSKRGGAYNDAAEDPSNFGSLVDVYAPGDGVAVMLPTEVVALDGGTSFAAPLVAGTAGLLKSFDPRAHMTSGEMKRMIVAGSVDSVTEPSLSGARKPILNAYGALKKAAETPGAPLCGSQRVWGNYGTGKIIVERVRGDPTTDDTLATVNDANQMNVVFAKHGGKTVQFSLQPAAGLVWTPSGWTNGTTAPNDGGVIAQYLGGSHDADSSVVLFKPGNDFELRLWKPGDLFETLYSPYSLRFSIPSSGVFVTGGNEFISPVKPHVFIARGIWRQGGATESYIEWFDMITKQAPTLLRTYNGKLILNVNQSEDGSELRVRLWVPPGNTCEYEFISLATPDSGQARRTIVGTAPPPLGGVYCKDDGTFSPRIAPGSGFSTSRTWWSGAAPAVSKRAH